MNIRYLTMIDLQKGDVIVGAVTYHDYIILFTQHGRIYRIDNIDGELT